MRTGYALSHQLMSFTLLSYWVHCTRSRVLHRLHVEFANTLATALGRKFIRDLIPRGPWKLIYYEAYLEQADALGREKYLKSGAGRRFLQSQLKNYLRKHPSKEARVNAAFTRIYTHVLNQRGSE